MTNFEFSSTIIGKVSCRLITYWPARSIFISGAGPEFRRNSRRASPYPTCCPLVRFSHKDAARDGPCAHGNASPVNKVSNLYLDGRCLLGSARLSRRFAFLACCKQVEPGGTRQGDARPRFFESYAHYALLYPTCCPLVRFSHIASLT